MIWVDVRVRDYRPAPPSGQDVSANLTPNCGFRQHIGKCFVIFQTLARWRWCAPSGGLRVRRDAVRVEHRVDVPQALDAGLQRASVPHLDDEAVLDHRIHHGAARLEDVHAALGERAREVLEQARPVVAVDLQLDAERLRPLTVPAHLREALGVLHERLRVRAVLAVDRDALAQRDVPDDRVARHRAAALGEPQHHVDAGVAVDLDAVCRGLRGRLRLLPLLVGDELLDGAARLDCGLALLQPLHQLVDDDRGGDLRLAERDVEVLALLEAHLSDHVGEQRRAGHLLRRQARALHVLVQDLAAGALRVLAALALEPGADLRLRARRLRERQPVARWPALLLRGQHLADVARLQLVVERHHLAVHLGADRAVPHVRVDLVREVERRGARGERLHLALRREHEDLVLEEVDLQPRDELLRVLQVLLPLDQRVEPLRLAGLVALVLVEPVRGDAELGRLVHLARADLDLERPPLGPDHGRVEGLVHVELGHRHEVLEAAGQRLPQRVDHADRAVAVLDRVHEHTHRREVVDLVELAALLRHLRVDRVEVLRPARDLRLDADRLELLRQVGAGARHVPLALRALLVHEALDLLELARVERLERHVLELPLDRVDAEPVRQRGEDLERLLRLLLLLLLRHRLDRAHVVQAIRELDEDHADVRGHRDHHLAVVLGLAIVAALERDAGELRDAVDQVRDLLAELVAHLDERRARVLDGVVQERGAQRRGVEPHPGADLRDADRVHDEVLARLAALVGVPLTGEQERALDQLAIDVRLRVASVLLDHGEQIAEEAALELVQLDGRGHGVAVARRRAPTHLAVLEVDLRSLAVALRALRGLLLRGAATHRFRELGHAPSLALPTGALSPAAMRREPRPARDTRGPSRSARAPSCTSASARARCAAPRACGDSGPARSPRGRPRSAPPRAAPRARVCADAGPDPAVATRAPHPREVPRPAAPCRARPARRACRATGAPPRARTPPPARPTRGGRTPCRASWRGASRRPATQAGRARRGACRALRAPDPTRAPARTPRPGPRTGGRRSSSRA